MLKSKSSIRPKIAVVYHIFPHYRKAVVDTLLDSNEFDYFFYAGVKDPFTSNLQAITQWPTGRFTNTALRPIRLRRSELTKHGFEGGPLWQKGILGLPFDRSVKVVIYLGDAYFLSTWVSALFARMMGKRVIFWTIGWLREESGLKSKIRVAFYKLGHALLIYGENARRLAIENGLNAERVRVICNSLDISGLKAKKDRTPEAKGAEIRMRVFSDATTPVCICVSRLTFKRQLALLFEALNLMHLRGVRMNCLLVGDGPERAALEQRATELNVKVAFIGPCFDEDQLAEYYSAAAVCASPGMAGLNAIQSLAFGVPVVTHDDPWQQSPEYEAIVPHESGELFKAGSSEDLSQALERYSHSVRPSAEVQSACWDAIKMKFVSSYQAQVIADLVHDLGVAI